MKRDKRVRTIFKGNKFDERQQTSADAKAALLAKFKTRPAPDDPALLAKQAERLAIAEAREIRAAERRKQRELDDIRLAAERAAAAAAEATLQAEREAAARDAARQEALLRLEQKAARDKRYAARKARR